MAFGGTAAEFVEESMGSEYCVKERTISARDSDLIEDGKLADIFFVQKEGHTVAVVKQFGKTKKPRRDYHREVCALQEMKEQGTLPFSEIITAGEDNDHFYIIMKLAEGRSFNQWLKEIGRSSLGREKKLDALCKGIEQAGRHLRKFHLFYQRENFSLDTEAFNNNEKYFGYLQNRIKNNPISGIEAKLLNRREKELEKRLTHHKIIVGQIHGDLHPGNIFYASKSDEVTFIDFSTLTYPKRINKGLPVAQDAVKCILTLKVVAKIYGLTDQEIDKIESAFYRGYGKDMIGSSEKNYFGLIQGIDLIHSYDVDHEEVEDKPKLLAQLNTILDYGTELVRDQLTT